MTYKVNFGGPTCFDKLVGKTAILTSMGDVDPQCGHMRYAVGEGAPSISLAKEIGFDLPPGQHLVFCACHTPDVLCPVIDMGEWKKKKKEPSA